MVYNNKTNMVHISFESEPWMDRMIQTVGMNGFVAKCKELMRMHIAGEDLMHMSDRLARLEEMAIGHSIHSIHSIHSTDQQVQAPVAAIPLPDSPSLNDRTCTKCRKVLGNKKGLANHKRTCDADLAADQALYNNVMGIK